MRSPLYMTLMIRRSTNQISRGDHTYHVVVPRCGCFILISETRGAKESGCTPRMDTNVGLPGSQGRENPRRKGLLPRPTPNPEILLESTKYATILSPRFFVPQMYTVINALVLYIYIYIYIYENDA